MHVMADNGKQCVYIITLSTIVPISGMLVGGRDRGKFVLPCLYSGPGGAGRGKHGGRLKYCKEIRQAINLSN